MTRSISKFALAGLMAVSLLVGACAAATKKTASDLSTGGMTSGGGGWGQDHFENLYLCSAAVRSAATNEDRTLDSAVIYKHWIGAAANSPTFHVSVGSKSAGMTDRLLILSGFSTNGGSMDVSRESSDEEPNAAGTLSLIAGLNHDLQGSLSWNRRGQSMKTSVTLSCKGAPPKTDESFKKLPKRISCKDSARPVTLVAVRNVAYKYDAILDQETGVVQFHGMGTLGDYRNEDPFNVDVRRAYISIFGTSDSQDTSITLNTWKASDRNHPFSRLSITQKSSNSVQSLAMTCTSEF